MAEQINGSVANLGSTGSPAGVPADNQKGGAGAGQTQNTIDAEQHKNLEELAGRQGQELGEYRSFFEGVAPLLDKLDKSPELVEAILNDKIDAALIKAASEGKISLESAQTVTKAEKEVKQDLGKKAFEAATPEQIEALVEKKANEMFSSKVESRLKEFEETRAFEESVNAFISSTPDFEQHAEAIDKWLDKHDVTDIKVAYYAVKGELSEAEAKKQAALDDAEAAKNIALNAGGGSSRATYNPGDASIVDQLIAGKANPNVF